MSDLLLFALLVAVVCIAVLLTRIGKIITRIHRQLIWMMRSDKQQIGRAYLDGEYGYFDQGGSIEALVEQYPTRYSGDDAQLRAYSDVIRLQMRQRGESPEEIERSMEELWQKSNSHRRAQERMKAANEPGS